MYDWANFFDKYPKLAGEQEFLKQVGKTVGGIPITDEQFRILVDSVKEHLEIKEDDRLLDLCCGNGIITKELANQCEFVLGIDFSEQLIKMAKKHNSGDKVEYLQMDVRSIGELSSSYKGYFTKILCYEALAFFDKKDFNEMLKNILVLSVENPVIFFGSVLDRERIWNFFNTFRRKMFYLIQIKLLRKEVGIGRWWTAHEIENICNKRNLTSTIFYQPEVLHTSHYRSDVKIEKRS